VVGGGCGRVAAECTQASESYEHRASPLTRKSSFVRCVTFCLRAGKYQSELQTLGGSQRWALLKPERSPARQSQCHLADWVALGR